MGRGTWHGDEHNCSIVQTGKTMTVVDDFEVLRYKPDNAISMT